MAAFSVSNLLDGTVAATGDLPGSLRQAIFDANNTVGTDTIDFDGALAGGLIRLTEGQLAISDEVTVDGAALGITITADANADDVLVAGTSITDVAATLASDATLLNDNSRVLRITGAGSDTTIIGLTLTGGRTTGNGDKGGGVRSDAPLTITDSTVSGNSTTGNTGLGGGIADIGNSTVSGNSSTGNGGGIFTDDATVLIDNSTITGNSTSGAGGGIGLRAGGIIPDELLTLRNSIVAGNSDNGTAPDVQMPGDPVNNLTVEFSLIGDNTGSSLAEAQTPDVNGNLIGSAAGSGIIDPLLGSLQNNGGPTETHALMAGSPAIDAGDPSAVAGVGDTPLFDQRGLGRVDQGRIDMGSFEIQVAPTADIIDVTPDPRNTSVGNVTIDFDEAVTGVDISDFTLTRDGQSVDISGLTVSQNNPQQNDCHLDL